MMKVIIVENEKLAADHILRLLKKIDEPILVIDIVESVEKALIRLNVEPCPDLILMDIQLDDGLCFEIFETLNIKVPIVFTTAYDQHMLKAFKVNSIDYLLKPIEEGHLRIAINKFKSLQYKNTIENDLLKRLIKEIDPVYKNRFLIKIGAKYKPVQVSDIGCFYVLERTTFIRTFSGRDFPIDYSLDYIQHAIDFNLFFRINRNCIININAIRDILSYSSNRLKVHLNYPTPFDDLIVSRERVSEFKRWIDK